MDHLKACPVCQGTDFSHFISCKDYTVSKETFHLEQCSTCGFVMTNPKPSDAELPRYYQSDAYISHSNKSSNIIDQIYKISRTYTLQWKYRLIQQLSLNTPNSILDYGCGTGAFLKECKKNGINVTGVEPSEVAREQARKNTQSLIVPDISEIANQYDAITLWHVLEHVSNLNETLTLLKSHLAENGTMFIAVPNLKSADANKYGKFWAAYDVPRHLWHFTANTMERLLNNHHLKLINVVPMKLDAYYVSLLSEKYRSDGKGAVAGMIKAALQGWKSNSLAKNTREYSSLIYIARK
ncbi:MAG: class I SAM-dependent methyltransferase [Chryseosolibacter sp.]